MAQRIQILIWKGPKQVFGTMDRPSTTAVTKLRKLGFTGPHPETGRYQIKCGKFTSVDETFARVSQEPGVVALDAEPETIITGSDRPATKAQRDLLAKFRIELPVELTVNEASYLIDATFAEMNAR